MFLLDDPANTDQSQKVLFCNQELSFVTCQSLRLVTRRQSRSRGSDTNNYWLKLIINSHTLCWAQSTVQQIGDISIEGWDGDCCKLLEGAGRRWKGCTALLGLTLGLTSPPQLVDCDLTHFFY